MKQLGSDREGRAEHGTWIPAGSGISGADGGGGHAGLFSRARRPSPFAEGVARICRALVGIRSKYALLVKMMDHVDKRKGEALLDGPIRALLRRGRAEGAVREDLSETEMLSVLQGLVQAASRLVSRGEAGVERAATIASSVFLDGIARPGPGGRVARRRSSR